MLLLYFVFVFLPLLAFVSFGMFIMIIKKFVIWLMCAHKLFILLALGVPQKQEGTSYIRNGFSQLISIFFIQFKILLQGYHVAHSYNKSCANNYTNLKLYTLLLSYLLNPFESHNFHNTIYSKKNCLKLNVAQNVKPLNQLNFVNERQ